MQYLEVGVVVISSKFKRFIDLPEHIVLHKYSKQQLWLVVLTSHLLHTIVWENLKYGFGSYKVIYSFEKEMGSLQALNGFSITESDVLGVVTREVKRNVDFWAAGYFEYTERFDSLLITEKFKGNTLSEFMLRSGLSVYDYCEIEQHLAVYLKRKMKVSVTVEFCARFASESRKFVLSIGEAILNSPEEVFRDE